MALQIEITDEDIAVVQKVMGRDFSDSERSQALKTMCSCDIQACPGSGKTTLLVAKLAILARKIPSPHQGICVLSHTNAARAEIERSLGAYASSVFRYPHFIGTIQAFVDQFLAIPALVQKFGIRPWAIDDEAFERVATSRFGSLPYKTKFALNQHVKNLGGDGASLLRKVRHRLADQGICLYDDGKEEAFPASSNTPTFQNVKDLKDAITREGCVAYHDAFSWAKWYLDQFPDLCRVVSGRFPWVFIDEMQDTDTYQWELLSRVFSKAQLVQCFGDANQAIYTARSSGAQPGWQPVALLQISSSHRLSQSIARLSQNVCLVPQTLTGNAQRPCCQHTVFLFAKDSAQTILPAFAKLLASEGLTEGPFKAVGAVGKGHARDDVFTITSYWPSFQKRQNASSGMPHMRDYFDSAQRVLTQTGNCGEAIDCLTNGMLELLRRNGNRCDPTTKRPYTTGTLLGPNRGKFAADLPLRLRNQLVDWCRALAAGCELEWQRCANEVQGLLAPLLTQKLNSETATFLFGQGTSETNTGSTPRTDNVFRYNVQGRQILVEVNTTHSVKGQNHQATLLLETYYYEHDLEKLLPYLVGERPKAPGKRLLSRLPLAYVAMTRPTHLLCLAVCRDHISPGYQQKLLSFGWKLQEV